MNKIPLAISSLLFSLLSSSEAYGCWAKPHEPNAVVVGKIIEIEPSRGLSDPVVYILATDVWLKGIPTETITLEVADNFNNRQSGCFQPFNGEIGEIWAFQSFTQEQSNYIFDHERGIRLKDSEGKILRKISQPMLGFYNKQQTKGDVYQSKFSYQLEQFWSTVKSFWRSHI